MGRSQGSYHLKDIGGVKVNARHGHIAFGFFGFLFNAHNSAIEDLGHAITLRVRDLLEKNEGVVGMFCGLGNQIVKGILENVISQNHQRSGTLGKKPRQAKSLGDASRFVLNLVGDLTPVVLAGPQKFDKVPHMLGTRNKENVVESNPRQLFQGKIDHGIGADRKQMFIGDPGQFAKPSSLAAC